MITGYREQPKMGPTFKRPPAPAEHGFTPSRSITVGSRSQPNASLAISSPRMGPMPPSNYQPRSAPVNLTVGSGTPEAVPNKNVERFSQGSFGIGKEYDKYTKIHQNAIDGGSTLEQAMYLSRTATPQDHINAFGNRDNWKKWGGGNKRASGTNATRMAAINRIRSRRAEAEARNNPFSIPTLNSLMALNAGPSTPFKYDAHMNIFVPNMGGARPNNIRPRCSASLKV